MKRIAFVVLSALALAACAGGRGQLPDAPPAGEPAGYAGIDSSQLRLAMGNPAFTRKESGGTQMWRYDGQACKAFFFLYPKGASLSVQHVETIPRPQDAAADVSCLNRLRVDGKATS